MNTPKQKKMTHLHKEQIPEWLEKDFQSWLRENQERMLEEIIHRIAHIIVESEEDTHDS